MSASLVGSEMCIRDRNGGGAAGAPRTRAPSTFTKLIERFLLRLAIQPPPRREEDIARPGA
eukprot:11280734-Alexandrium_andersonii.AAC.1